MQSNGYIDLQVNGYLGVDFSDVKLSEESCAMACRKLLEHGTAGFLATVITSNETTYEKNLKIISSVASSPEFKGRVLGIHAEGPFISDRPGYVGAHNPAFTRKPDLAFLEKMQQWASGAIKLITIAAEIKNADKLAAAAVQMAITVSLGHQNAGIEDFKKLAAAGATLITHAGNGMSNMVHRHKNPLLAAMAVDELTAMIITDGHHLPDYVIKTIIRAKGVDKVIVTSDASPIAGMPPGIYNVLGNPAVLEENRLLHNPEKQCLVGSSSTIIECVDYLKSLNILSPQELTAVTRTNPLKAINL